MTRNWPVLRGFFIMNEKQRNEAVDEKQAARILGLSPATLRKMRSLGPQSTGLPPIPYFKYSSRCVRYSVAELETWKESFHVSEGGAA